MTAVIEEWKKETEKKLVETVKSYIKKSGEYAFIVTVMIILYVTNNGVIPKEEFFVLQFAVTVVIIGAVITSDHYFASKEVKRTKGEFVSIIKRYVPIIDEKTRELVQCQGTVQELRGINEVQQSIINDQRQLINKLITKVEVYYAGDKIGAEMLQIIKDSSAEIRSEMKNG